MARERYKFNPDILRFERVRYTFKDRLIQAMPFMSFTALLAVAILYYGHDFFETPGLNKMHHEQSQILLNLSVMKNEINKFDAILTDIEYNDDHLYRTYFEVDPLSFSIRNAGFGGNSYNELYNNSRYKSFITEISSDLDKLSKKLVVQSKSFDKIIELAKNKEKRLAARPSIQPVSINELTRFGSAYGMRIHPILKIPKMHEGIDLTCPDGTKIFAPAAGVITESGYTTGGYGIKIVIDHGFGYRTIYGHLSKVLVNEGEKVERGTVIGLVGNTGLSTCAHLHYEVMVYNKKVNPLNYYASDLSPDEYDKMISLYSISDPSFDIN